MHTLPTNTSSDQTNLIGTLTQSSALRNSYLHPNGNNDQIKSAFKPVKPRISINPIPTNLPKVQSNPDLSMHSTPINSKNTLKTVPHSIYTSSYESYTHTNWSALENVKKDEKSSNRLTTCEKTPKKNATNFRMAYKYVADRTGHGKWSKH